VAENAGLAPVRRPWTSGEPASISAITEYRVGDSLLRSRRGLITDGMIFDQDTPRGLRGGARSDPPGPAACRVAILAADRLHAHLLRETVCATVAGARVISTACPSEVTGALLAGSFDLLIAGVEHASSDFDVLDFLAALRGQRPATRVLVIADRREHRVVMALRALAVPGAFDPASEEIAGLARALLAVVEGGGYWSPSLLQQARECLSPRGIGRLLTPTEQLVFSVIGDGSDDETAARCLGVKAGMVLVVRRELHRKLRVQHRGELLRAAIQHGFVRITAAGSIRPGFRMLEAACLARKGRPGSCAAFGDRHA